MKKITVLLLALLACFVLAGCASVKSPMANPDHRVPLAGIDYEIIGPVSVEGTTRNVLGIVWWGGASYADLLKKAQEMGADDVVNVYEDRSLFTASLIYNEIGVLWTGTAIKYKDTFTENLPAIVEGNSIF